MDLLPANSTPLRHANKYNLSYEHRLHKRRDFLLFFEGSDVFRLSNCTIFRIPNKKGHYRLGITIKNKASSVERNRLKRVIRESFRKISPLLGSFDFNVVISGKKTLSYPFLEKLGISLRRELIDAFNHR